MKIERNFANKNISTYAIIIAIYVTISTLLGTLSFGIVQIRIAELLLVLCLKSKQYIIPISIGCLLANLIGVINGVNPFMLDIVIGSFATFLSAVLVYKCRNILWFNRPVLSLLMPVIINGIMVGYELSLYFDLKLLVLIAYVSIGEFISVTVLGLLLYKPIIATIKTYMK